jgi:hypothetical protein
MTNQCQPIPGNHLFLFLLRWLPKTLTTGLGSGGVVFMIAI